VTEISGVVALLDAVGPFTLGPPEETFPDAMDDDWRRAAELDPDAFAADGRWHLAFRCFAIRRPAGRFTLVDAGVGDAGSPAAAWAPVPGQLPESLTAAGIALDDVDTVVLTHLHEDHVGWSVGADGVPTFPNARHLVQDVELHDLETRGAEPLLEAVVRPLRRAGQLDPVDGRTRLTGDSDGPRITLLPTPGHTPGHQSVLVESDAGDVMITGDVAVHAVQLVSPDVGYAYERYQPAARQTRHRLLAEAATRQALLATAHLNPPFVPVPTGGR
jgi:glyoxylase-like metal-dependent hydrolase (beta-lactamase superfamily II)